MLFAAQNHQSFLLSFYGDGFGGLADPGSSVWILEVSKRSWLWIKSSCATCAFVFRIFRWPLFGLGAAGMTFRIFACVFRSSDLWVFRTSAVHYPISTASYIITIWAAVVRFWINSGLSSIVCDNDATIMFLDSLCGQARQWPRYTSE